MDFQMRKSMRFWINCEKKCAENCIFDFNGDPWGIELGIFSSDQESGVNWPSLQGMCEKHDSLDCAKMYNYSKMNKN